MSLKESIHRPTHEAYREVDDETEILRRASHASDERLHAAEDLLSLTRLHHRDYQVVRLGLRIMLTQG